MSPENSHPPRPLPKRNSLRSYYFQSPHPHKALSESIKKAPPPPLEGRGKRPTGFMFKNEMCSRPRSPGRKWYSLREWVLSGRPEINPNKSRPRCPCLKELGFASYYFRRPSPAPSRREGDSNHRAYIYKRGIIPPAVPLQKGIPSLRRGDTIFSHPTPVKLCAKV